MVPGIGGGEYIVIALVALLVVGPKDLPKLLRQLGRFVGKMRAMADDFRTSFDEMARQSELDDLRKEVEALRTQRSIPVLDDVKNEMNSLSSDIEASLQASSQPVSVPQVDDRGVLLDDPYNYDNEPLETPEPVKASRARKAGKKKSTIEVVALADPGEAPVAAPKLKAIKGSGKPKAEKATAKTTKSDKPAQRKRSAS